MMILMIDDIDKKVNIDKNNIDKDDDKDDENNSEHHGQLKLKLRNIFFIM